MKTPRALYAWPRKRLDELTAALEQVQAHADSPVSLVSPNEGPLYRDTVFFWLTDHDCGVVWQATYAAHVEGKLAESIAKKLGYAVWRASNPERECIDCTKPFLPSHGWDEVGYPRDVCPPCVARRITLLGVEQVIKPYDPHVIVQAVPRGSIDDVFDGPIDSLG